MLYANSGSFAENLKTDMVAFADDFANATATSFTRENDTTAELILSVDSNGVKVEDMDLTGTVTIKNGALVNRWGDARSEECVQTRSYTMDSMGKGLTDGDVDIIKDIVGGFGNTKMGTLVDVVSGLGTAGTTIYTALEIIGVVESEKAKLDKIYNAIQQMSSQLCDIEAAIEEQNAVAAAKEVSDFYENKLNPLLSSMKIVQAGVSDAKRYLKSQGIVEPAKKTEYDNAGNCTSSQELVDEWKVYLGKVMNRVRETRSAEYNTLRERFEAVCACLKQNNSVSSIIDKYDRHMTYYYNFDTMAYDDRENFRKTLSATVALAALDLCMYNQYAFEEPETYTIEVLDDMYLKAKAFIQSKAIKRRDDNKALLITKNTTINSVLRPVFSYPICSYVEFSDHEIEQFVKRMNGRTFGEECELAGITMSNTFQYCDITRSMDEMKDIGVVFADPYCVAFRRWKIIDAILFYWNAKETKYYDYVSIYYIFEK